MYIISGSFGFKIIFFAKKIIFKKQKIFIRYQLIEIRFLLKEAMIFQCKTEYNFLQNELNNESCRIINMYLLLLNIQ